MASNATASYKLKLEQNATAAANDAAKSLEKLQSRIEADQKALRGMQAAMKRMDGGTSVSIQAHKQLTDRIEAQKQKIAQAQARYVELGGTFEKVTKQTHSQSSATKEASGLLDKFKTKVSGAGGELGELGKSMGVSGVAAGALAGSVLLVVGAVTALASGVAYLTAKLISYGIAAAGAARSQNLLLQAAQKSSWWSRGGTVNLKADAAMLDRIQSKYGGVRSQLQETDRSLRRAGLSGTNLQKAMTAVSIASSAGATGMWSSSAVMQRMLGAAYSKGESLDKVLAQVKKKFGTIATEQALSLNTQLQTAHDMVAQLFRDVNIEPLLKGLHQVLGLFSQTTVTGKALHDLVTGLLNPLFKGAAKGTPILVKLFEYGVLYALKFGNAILKAELALLKFANAHIDRIKQIPALLKSMSTEAKYFGVGLGVMAAALAAVGALLAGIVAIGAVVVVGFISFVGQMVSVGYDLITGLAHGIAKGAKAVWGAAKSVALGAVHAVKQALSIHSPSLVFQGVGENVSKGMALGIDGGSDHVDKAARSMVSIPDAGARRQGNVGLGGIHVGAITVQVNGDAKNVDTGGIRAAVRQALEDIMEGAANTLGAQLEPEAA